MAKKFGKWVVKDSLSGGGQSDTFRVYEEGNEAGGYYVLKVLKNLDNVKRRQRFRSEVRVASRLSHPNLIRVIDADLDFEKPYHVTEYCSGGSLSPAILQGKTLTERLTLFQSICKGVAYAHAHGVVHRDLKPLNIFIRADGTPVVGDFGLCFLNEDGQRFTVLEEAVGPRLYMAPELESGRAETVGPVSDVYSLGKVLYWILATRIFAREQHRELAYNLAIDPIFPELTLVYELLDRTITTNPTGRLQNGSEVLDALETIMQKIAVRRRVLDLVGLPQFYQSNRDVRIASFRPGSIVSWRFLEAGGMKVMGFGAQGSLLAAWGLALPLPREGYKELKILTISEPLLGNYSVGFPEGIAERGFYQASTFDERGNLHITVTENSGPDGGRLVNVVSFSKDGQITKNPVATIDGVPAFGAIAIGPEGQVGVYRGNWQSSTRRGIQSVTFVRDATGLSRRDVSQYIQFCGPLAFDKEGVLHQAGVVETEDGRELHYISRGGDGEWTASVVNARSRTSNSDGCISLTLKPNGTPIILSDSNERLAVYEKQSAAWSKVEIDLQPFVASFGLTAGAGGLKQILFDEDGGSHIALATSNGNFTDVLYFAFDQRWKVIEQRDFPAREFFGMGIDGRGIVHLAMR
jgi:hypothetical protein